MKKLVIILLAFGVLVSVFSGEARSFELSVSPNYGMVLSPDLGGDSGGLGYTVRLLMAGSMFTNYEMGFETGVLPIRKYDIGDDEITFDTIPITVILRCNFYALGDIKPYFLGGAGVYHIRKNNENSETDNKFGASAGLGTRMASAGMPFFVDMLLRGSTVFDYEDDVLVMLHVGLGLGLKF